MLIAPSRLNRNQQANQILEASERLRSEPKYDLPQIKHLITKNPNKKESNLINNEANKIESKKIEIKHQQQQNQHQRKNSKMINKLGPHVNNENVNNIYKIYAPYLKQQSPVKYNKYSLEKNAKNANGNNYLKNLEKYYDYYNVYKPLKVGNSESNSQRVNLIPNRKLSPIKKSVLNY